MKKIIFYSSLFFFVGCAPAYMVPQGAKVASINVTHQGDHPSSSSIDIFSEAKCEKQYYVGELADVGTNIDLKKSMSGKVEANKVIYFSGTRIWLVHAGALESWCSSMFSFTPKEGATYDVKVNGNQYGACEVEVIDSQSNSKPADLKVYKLNRICRGDDVYHEK
mgnify:CR=1 FL=1